MSLDRRPPVAAAARALAAALVVMSAGCSLDAPSDLQIDPGSVLAVAGGQAHACALRANGDAWCWGNDSHGQLGADGGDSCTYGGTSESCSLTPVLVQGGHVFSVIAAGGRSTCALTPSGQAWCWGANDYGQLGDGTTQPSTTPVAVEGSHRFVNLSMGNGETCAITDASEAWCWGSGRYGRLGAAAPDQCTVGGTAVPCSTRPLRVQLTEQTVLTAVSGSDGVCAALSTRQVLCWGYNEYGQLGYGITDSTQAPTAMPDAPSINWLAAGATHTCILTSGSVARCVGANDMGQLGDGTTTSHDSLVAVTGNTQFALLFAASDTATARHTCALTLQGAAWCWGSNEFGQLGVATTETCAGGTPCSTSPQLVSTTRVFNTMSVGTGFSCAVSTQRAWCWGDNSSGQLGAGDTAAHTGPQVIAFPAG